MPFYPLRCVCGEKYDAYTPSMSKREEAIAAAVCEKCGSSEKTPLVAGFGFQFGQPVGTDIWNNSHDYRFHHNLPKVQAERERAKEKWGDPYNVGPTDQVPV